MRGIRCVCLTGFTKYTLVILLSLANKVYFVLLVCKGQVEILALHCILVGWIQDWSLCAADFIFWKFWSHFCGPWLIVTSFEAKWENSVCVHTYMHTLYVYTFIYIHKHTCIYIHIHIRICVCIYMHLHAYICTHARVGAHRHTQICIYDTCTYIMWETLIAFI